MASRRVSLLLVVAVLSQALSVPVDVLRVPRGFADNELESKENVAPEPLGQDSIPAASERRPSRDDDFDDDEGPSKVSLDSTTEKVEYATPVFEDDSDEDDDFEPMNTAPAGGGSNIFSLLRLANALFPSSSGANRLISNLIRGYFNHQLYPNFPQQLYPTVLLRRSDVSEKLINVDSIEGLKLNPAPFERQESDEDDDNSSDDHDDDDDHESESIEDDNNAAEESIEVNGNGNQNAKPQESNGDNSEDDYSDEPEGDGGGILGILAGLSGGEDGSDLGSLLAAISGIVGNLSGDGFDLNALIGSGIGLFVGLLSEGAENPGEVIASYLLTSVDTITGGGAQNNGAFFGKFLSKLVKGISAQGGNSPSGEPASPIWTLKMDLLRAFLQFATSLLGKASSSSSSASNT